MKKYAFSKMQALANDFVVMQLERMSFSKQDIIKICDRHLGIGCDQFLILLPHDEDDSFFLQIFNADGSEAFQCGNGIRCVARYVYENNLCAKSQFIIATSAGRYEMNIHSIDKISVNMNAPIFEPRKIPLDVLTPSSQKEYDIITSEGTQKLIILSMGNPHGVVFVDDINTVNVAELGKELSHHACFPERANIEFVQVVDRSTLKIRIYERGAAETQACGSGACAAMVAAKLKYSLSDSVDVHMHRGSLLISWDGQETSPVYMTGEACHVFDGSIALF